MQAVKITIGGRDFLLPDTHADNYDFPTYIEQHRTDIGVCIKAYNEWLKAPLSDMAETPNMAEFKKVTGIIGVPFDLRDPTLYALDRNIDIVLKCHFDE